MKSSIELVLQVAKNCGIESPDCNSCAHIEHDNTGCDGWGGTDYYYCEDPRSNLRSFPFKKPQKCWYPNFWLTKFAFMIKSVEDWDNAVGAKEFKTACEPLAAIAAANSGESEGGE